VIVLLHDVVASILLASGWIRWRDRITAQHANHTPKVSAPPAQPKHNIGEWLARKPVDLDQQDRRGT
jgi:hypothetical protein